MISLPTLKQKRRNTLPETNSSPLKMGFPKRKGLSSNHPFSGTMLVSGRETTADIGSNRFKQVKEINFAQLSDLGVVFVG